MMRCGRINGDEGVRSGAKLDGQGRGAVDVDAPKGIEPSGEGRKLFFISFLIFPLLCLE